MRSHAFFPDAFIPDEYDHLIALTLQAEMRDGGLVGQVRRASKSPATAEGSAFSSTQWAPARAASCAKAAAG